jgi:quinol monooxygenase YgiN
MAATSTRQGPFVVIAEFDVRPEGLERFLELARDDAAQSVAKEPGCHQFDVTVEQSDPNHVLLYEVYDDEAAFNAHLQMPHLAVFRDGIEPLVTGRKARRLTRVHG